jgi:hypothetical protein
MDPQDKRILLRTLELAEENNEMIAKMWRSYRVGRAMRVLYWVIIIGVSIGALYFIQPYVDAVRDTYSGLSGDINEFLTK